MSLDKIVEEILSSRPALKRREVYKMIEEKKGEAEKFFTDESAARIVALELGVEIFQKPFQLDILVKDLVSGLNDVTVTGRVIAVYPSQTYTRRDLTEGKFIRLLIADRSGKLKVVLWDDKTIETGKVEQGQIIKISHGYVREGLDGKLELHVGSRGNVQISSSEVEETKYPTITQWIKKVVGIEEEGGPITVEGTIATAPTVREVFTSQNEKVAVASFELRDNTGKIAVSAWRKLAEVAKDLAVGTRIKIKNAYVRKSFADQLELTSRSFTSIDILTGREK